MLQKESLKQPPFLVFLNPTSYFNFLFFLSSFLICFSARSSSYLPTPLCCQRTYSHHARTMAKREHRTFWDIRSWKPNKWDICTSWGAWKASVKSLQAPCTMNREIYPLPFGDQSTNQSPSLSASPWKFHTVAPRTLAFQASWGASQSDTSCPTYTPHTGSSTALGKVMLSPRKTDNSTVKDCIEPLWASMGRHGKKDTKAT